MIVQPGTVIGQYTILNLLGQGNMGIVYEALDQKSGQNVAIKMLHVEYGDNEGLSTRFEREIMVMQMLNHPHIVPLLDFGIHEGMAYFAMALIPGMSLAAWLRLRSFSPLEILSYLEPLCSALHYAHMQNVLHRDVKPSNILLDTTADEPIIYLSDFGISKVLGMKSLTETQMQIGTPNYISPEQIADLPLMAATDIYSLTIVIYEMLLHRLPFDPGTEFQMIMAHMEAVPRRPSEIVPSFPGGLESVLLRGLAKDPLDRYASSEQFCQAYADALAQLDEEQQVSIYSFP